MGLLDRDVVLLTGGAAGLGLALAEYCIDQGAQVAVLAPEAEEAARLATVLGEQVLVVQASVTEAQDLLHAKARIKGRWGRLDAIICNHGLFEAEDVLAAMPTRPVENQFLELFQRNVLSNILIARVFQDALAESGGAVVFTAPTEALRSETPGLLFAASQAANQVVISGLAQELAPKVHVSGIVCAPGAEPRGAAHGLGQYGALCAFLASRHNRGPTGQVVPVDSGLLHEPAG